MFRRIAAVAAAISLFLCGALPARATEPFAQVKTYVETWVGFPRGVRNIGMGATGTADVSGTSTGYFNPAAVAFTGATTVLGSYEDMFANISLSDALVMSPIPFRAGDRESAWRFAAAFGYSRESMQPQMERTIFLPDGTGRTFDVSEWALTAIASGAWTRGDFSLSTGVASKYLHSSLSIDFSGWAFDLGAIAAYEVDLDGATVRPRVGYAALNLDRGMDVNARTGYVATEQRGGFGFDLDLPVVHVYGRDVPSASLSMEYDRISVENDDDRDFAAGFELSFVDILHARYGVIDDYFNYRTLGVGLGWDYGQVLWRVDYAHIAHTPENFFGLDDDRDVFGLLIGVRW